MALLGGRYLTNKPPTHMGEWPPPVGANLVEITPTSWTVARMRAPKMTLDMRALVALDALPHNATMHHNMRSIFR